MPVTTVTGSFFSYKSCISTFLRAVQKTVHVYKLTYILPSKSSNTTYHSCLLYLLRKSLFSLTRNSSLHLLQIVGIKISIYLRKESQSFCIVMFIWLAKKRIDSEYCSKESLVYSQQVANSQLLAVCSLTNNSMSKHGQNRVRNHQQSKCFCANVLTMLWCYTVFDKSTWNANYGDN